MFKIAPTDHFWWPVKVSLPAEKGGRYDTHSFKVKYSRLTQARLTEIQGMVGKGMFTDREFAREIVLDWEEVNDENGAPMPFNEQTRDRVLDIPLVQAAIINAYNDALREATRKN